MSIQRSRTAWTPILTGGLAETARQAVDGVARELADRPIETDDAEALCGFALFYAHLALADESDAWLERANDCLNLAIGRVSCRQAGGASMYDGISGVGWTIEHVSKLLAGDSDAPLSHEANDPLADLDTALVHALRRDWHRGYDLISGLVGVGVYWLERAPRSVALSGLERIVDQLEEWAEPSAEGFAWFTPPNALPAWQRELCPAGYYNLGVAHGVPGIIYLLSEVAARGYDSGRAPRLLDGAVRWLLAQRPPDDGTSRFSSWVAPGGSAPGLPRPAWCYGDLGVGGLLHHVARRSDNAEWADAARVLLDRYIEQQFDQSRTLDAGLCHGACGVAQIYNRVYQADGPPQCREAAVAWYERTLDMRQPGFALGGFPAWAQEPTPGFRPDATFLGGGIGVALSLLSAITHVEPRWDRRLLLSGCPLADAGGESAEADIRAVAANHG